MANIVYVLTNEAMPGLVKIGFTNDSLDKRLTQLGTGSGIPLPFECHFAAEVDNAPRVEKVLHQLFSEYRINPKREFFKLDPEKVVLALSIGSFKEIFSAQPVVEVEQKEALEKIKSKRPKLKLDALGIKAGDILTFSRDSSISATVTSNGMLNLNGQEMSLSAGALEILNKLGYKTSSVSGSIYWMFDGELLDERRRRIEAEQFELAVTPN